MLTIKLVVIGASGVGKTSLRSKYISGRFSGTYRATIGADFITKSLPHPTNPGELIMLQIWDTAGQERFSSLSSAFFRGADAALLMFDVNEAETLEALLKWWQEFRERAPLEDEHMQDFCCVVVGNKTDLVGSVGGNDPVSEAEARNFLQVLVPPSSSRPSSPVFMSSSEDLSGDMDESDDDEPLASSQLTVRPPQHLEYTPDDPPTPISPIAGHTSRSNSIAIVPPPNHSTQRVSSHSPKHRFSKSRSRSSYSGTVTTTHTTLTIYHTPSSSFFDSYHSARSSPELWSAAMSSPEPWSAAVSSVAAESPPDASSTLRRLATTSNRSASAASASTITPRLFAREQASSPTADTFLRNANGTTLPDRGPKLFFTSAMTGEGVSDVFEYIAKRVITRWEYNEQMEAHKLHMREASATETIRLQPDTSEGGRTGWSKCC